jgi:lipid-binding SYLF domain-containing protein
MNLKAMKLIVPIVAITITPLPLAWSQTQKDRPWNESTTNTSRTTDHGTSTRTTDRDVDNQDKTVKNQDKLEKKGDKISDRMENATKTLQEITSNNGKGIPASELAEARCIGVIPKATEVAVIAGGQHGGGVVTCKDAQGMWSAPAFFSMTGGSFGAQAGVERKDIVLLGMTEKARDAFFQKDFDLGAKAEATGGKNSASADLHSNDFRIYTMNNGVFAGLNVNGTVLHRDDDAIKALYGSEKVDNVLGGKVQRPAAARDFLSQVEHLQRNRRGA